MYFKHKSIIDQLNNTKEKKWKKDIYIDGRQSTIN